MANFQISENAFQPLTCTAGGGHIVVYEQDNQLFYKKFFNNGEITSAIVFTTLEPTDNVVFFRNCIVAIETADGYRLHILDDDLTPFGHCIECKTEDSIVHCFDDDDKEDLVVFTYNYAKQQFFVDTIGDYGCGERVNRYTVHDVRTIPTVVELDDSNYCLGWLDDDGQLIVMTDNAYNEEVPHYTVIQNVHVDYLFGARVDTNLVVFGGYTPATRSLRLTYYEIDSEELTATKVISHYHKSEYKNKSFEVVSLYSESDDSKGFMLLADAPDEPVFIQRFTHLGSFLYPLLKIGEQPGWSPSMSHSYQNALLVYACDNSEVWGRIVPVANIPELNNLTLQEIEE